jgi:hypothetical protein
MTYFLGTTDLGWMDGIRDCTSIYKTHTHARSFMKSDDEGSSALLPFGRRERERFERLGDVMT